MAVYHRRSSEGCTDFFVIVNPSRSFQQHWQQATRNKKIKSSAGDLHDLLLSCANSNWRLYVDEFEDQFEPLVCRTDSFTIYTDIEK